MKQSIESDKQSIKSDKCAATKLYLLEGLHKVTIHRIDAERSAYWKTKTAGTVAKSNPNAFVSEAAVRQEVVDRIAARKTLLYEEISQLESLTELKMLDRS